jgi:hypothetical protein
MALEELSTAIFTWLAPFPATAAKFGGNDGPTQATELVRLMIEHPTVGIGVGVII